MAAKCTRGRCCKWSCGIIGLVSLITGCVLIKVFSNLIHSKVDDNLPLKNGSTSYKNWLSPPAPVYFKVFVQHVSNADEVVGSGAKPNLVQKGPYTYREHRQKVNITYSADQTVITYRENKWYNFERKMSVGPETDVFTTISLPMLTIANMIKFEYWWVQDIVNYILERTDERLFINVTVGGLLWGYEDALLKEVKQVTKLPIDDKFGLFYKTNGSDDGLYQIHSGIGGGSMDKFAEIITWNGNQSLHFWNSTNANSINGSDGTMYPPFVDKSKPLYLFSSDLCRSLEIQYTEGYTLKGIDLDRFVVPPIAFANVSVNPYNRGFCTPYDHCLPAGLLNASVCRDGAPVIMSLPHFLDGDPIIRNRVIGMNPNRSHHQSVIDIEPMTGVVMNAAKRLQLNAYVTNISHIKDTVNIHPYIVHPLLWLEESATIDDKSAKDFKDEVLVAIKVTEAVQYGLIALGAFLMLIVIIVTIKSLIPSREKELQPIGETTPILPHA